MNGPDETVPATTRNMTFTGVGLAMFSAGLWIPFCFLQYVCAGLITAYIVALRLESGGALEAEAFTRAYLASWTALGLLVGIGGLLYAKTKPEAPFHHRFLVSGLKTLGLGVAASGVFWAIEGADSRVLQALTIALEDIIAIIVAGLIIDSSIRLHRWLWNQALNSSFRAGCIAAAGPLFAVFGLPLFIASMIFLGLMWVGAREGESRAYLEEQRAFYVFLADANSSVREAVATAIAKAENNAPVLAAAGMGTKKLRKPKLALAPMGSQSMCELEVNKPKVVACLGHLWANQGRVPSPVKQQTNRFMGRLGQDEAHDRAAETAMRVCERRCDLESNRTELIKFYTRSVTNSVRDFYRRPGQIRLDDPDNQRSGPVCGLDPETIASDRQELDQTQRALMKLDTTTRQQYVDCLEGPTRAGQRWGVPKQTADYRCKKAYAAFRCSLTNLSRDFAR